ncbi:hypothetical protein DW757_11505 [Clostridium sp. AM29-11AC]|nr:hypothetical protein DW757_11505 [Clostridium sp. AM29-11AC]
MLNRDCGPTAALCLATCHKKGRRKSDGPFHERVNFTYMYNFLFLRAIPESQKTITHFEI